MSKKKTKPKLSKTVIPTQPRSMPPRQQQQPKPLVQQSTVELARSLQEQFQAVSQCQQKIMQSQQNIWSLNAELDKRESESNAESPDQPKPEE